MNKTISKRLFIFSVIIFVIQFSYVYDNDLINNKTLTLHDNNPNQPEGTCQSEPYKNYLPFQLNIKTNQNIYNFYCAPTLHYQVFVLCLGWLIQSIFILIIFLSLHHLTSTHFQLPTITSYSNEHDINSKNKLHEINYFQKKLVVFCFFSIILLICTINEITHSQQTN